MPPTTSASRRAVAVFLNACLPGLGHLYVGRTKAGLLYLLGTAALALAVVPDLMAVMAIQIPTIDEAVAGAPMPSMPPHMMGFVLALTALFFISMWDVARKPKEDPK